MKRGELELDLEKLGWNEELEKELDHLQLEDVIVGRVYRVDRTEFGVLTEEGELSARLSGRLRSMGEARELPAVGDWVLMKNLGTGPNIFLVMDRGSLISRKMPGRETAEQLVAANVDIIFIVMGLDDDFNLRRMERYLVMASGSGCRPVVILNKSDLITESDPRIEEIRELSIGADIQMISAREGAGLEKISAYLTEGTTAVLVGSSGVGKSTIINALLGDSVQRTGEVRGADSKGRHITTHRELFLLPSGGMLIDNPGIREIQLWGEPGDIYDAFPDIHLLSKGCRFKDCSHLKEPGCAVRKALESGSLSSSRYENYCKMRKEMVHLASRMDKGAKAEERKKWKNITKDVKHYYKFKKEGR